MMVITLPQEEDGGEAGHVITLLFFSFAKVSLIGDGNLVICVINSTAAVMICLGHIQPDKYNTDHAPPPPPLHFCLNGTHLDRIWPYEHYTLYSKDIFFR